MAAAGAPAITALTASFSTVHRPPRGGSSASSSSGHRPDDTTCSRTRSSVGGMPGRPSPQPASVASFMEATFRQLAAAQDRPLAIDDVRPLPANNPSGAPNYFFIVICTLGGFLTVAALGLVAPTLPEYHRFAVMAAASLLAPIIGYLIGGPGYGTFSASFG